MNITSGMVTVVEVRLVHGINVSSRCVNSSSVKRHFQTDH